MISTYRDRSGKLVPMTHWEHRLAQMVTKGLPVYYDDHDSGTSMETTYGENDAPIVVTGYYNPAQRGGWTDPSWDAYYDEIAAWYYRPNKGWKEIKLTQSEIRSYADALMERAKDSYDGPDYADYDVPDYYDGTGRY